MLPDGIERVALLGWHVYPCSSYTKAGCFTGAHAAATCDLDTLAMWADRFPRCNWRVIFGLSGMWGLDLDVPGAGHSGEGDGVAAFADLARAYPPLPRCPATVSGGGGMALFFAHRGEPIAGAGGYPAAGIDPRRGRQSVTIPPSVHVLTKRPYVWRIAPWDCATPAAPDWLLRLVRPPPEPELRRPSYGPCDASSYRILAKATGLIRNAPGGTANDTLNRRAFILARWVAAGHVGEAEAIEHLAVAADERGIPRPEARATIKSAFRRGLTQPMPLEARR